MENIPRPPINDIEDFLKSLKLDDFIEIFKNEEIDLEILPSLNEEKLKAIGVNKLGPREKILKRIKELFDGNDTGSRSGPDYSPQKPVGVIVEGYEEKVRKPITNWTPSNTLERKQTSAHQAKQEVQTADVAPSKWKPAVMGYLQDKMTNVITTVQDALTEKFYGQGSIEKEIRIVLLGKTGNGKSATGNTILGKKVFESSTSGKSVTKQCNYSKAVRFDKIFNVVDTPGLFDTSTPNEITQREICKCIAITSPGPHAFILVLGLTRFTEEENMAVTHFIRQFGKDIYDYFILLFTRKDEIEDEGKGLYDHLKTLPEELQMLLKECGGRCLAFDNKLKGDEQTAQVRELHDMIMKIYEAKKGSCYTDEMYKKAERIIREKQEEELKKCEEKRQQELLEVERKVTERFERQLSEKQTEMNAIEERCKSLMEENEENLKKTDALTADIKAFEEMKKEQKLQTEEVNELQKTIETLEQDKMSAENKTEQNRCEIEKLRKDNAKLQKSIRKMQSDTTEEKLKIREKDLAVREKELSELRDKVREDIRREVEKDSPESPSNLLSSVVEVGKVVFQGIVGLLSSDD